MVTMKMMMIMIMMMTMIIRKGLYVHPATAVRAEEEFRKEKKNVCETQLFDLHKMCNGSLAC